MFSQLIGGTPFNDGTYNTPFIGSRIPKNKIALSLLKAVNFPIAAPSANITNKTSVTHHSDIDEKLKKKVLHLKEDQNLDWNQQ